MLVRPKAVSTPRASVRFAAALCEISGDFLIFPLALCVGNHTQRSAFSSSWLRGLRTPQPLTLNAKVTAADF